ncbi:MAG: AAA family ATPase [Acidobacteriota bacterium]|nr:AAA family ATPase [Acidobacteriota bacterium]
MSTFEEMSPSSNIARVRAVNPSGNLLYLELRNGQIATVSSSQPLGFKVGSIVLVRSEDDYIELAPDELWPEESWVGVVRLKHADITIVDSNGRWKMLPTRDDVTYREGNTVEARDSSGVIRVLSEDPIKYVDLPAVDDTTIAKFRSKEVSKKDSFEDFGGLQDVVRRAQELIEVPLKYRKELSDIGARPIKGVLFTGPPGTGKTMLARIIANRTDSSFYEISGPEVFSKWYGQSEEILRKLFEDAAKQDKAIIFFDEIDSVAGKRDDDSHEASRRVVAQLLTLMDGFTSNSNVIVIATTNRPQDIDPALRRPGRLDWEVNFPLPDRYDREAILQTSAKNLSTSEQLPHAFVAQNTDGWSAAELAAIWSEAALLAVMDDRSVIIAEDYIGGFERVLAQRGRAGLAPLGGSVS